MARIITIHNPQNPRDGLEIEDRHEKCNLDVIGAKFKEHPWIAVVYIEGKRYFPLREEWGDIDLGEKDIVYFMPHIGGVVTAIIIAVVAIAAIAVALLSVVQPPNIASTPEPDPVFDLKGQKNQIRLGSPIEDGYGRVRMWPSYATRAYNQYFGNDQYQYQLFCLGHGSWEIEEIYIEDTPIGNFQEVEFEITQPGGQVSLFPDNVETSPEVGGIELYAPNESDFVGNEFAGPFAANSANTETTRIEVDVVLPKGLYYSNDNGGLSERTIEGLFEYREIDDLGAPIGVWQTLANFAQTLATNTSQRFTLAASVTAGRYEVRASRTNNVDLDAAGNKNHRTGQDMVWGAMRAFLPSTKNYGDVTMLAIRARATNNLNDQSSNRVNVVGTRKLPIYNSSTQTMPAVDDYGARVATRSPIWAFVQILRAQYGGELDDLYIDYAHLDTEATQAGADQIYFDWIFDQRSTVWEVLKLPCFVNRSIPMLNGSRVTTIRDINNNIPSFVVSDSIAIDNTFEISKKLYDLNPNDGLEVEYTDPLTFKPEVVKCLLPGESGDNPKRVKLQGVTDRQKAFELGMYSWSKESYERTQINVTVGLEGYIPAYGDIVRVQSDVPRWGQAGAIISIVGTTITIDQVADLSGAGPYKLAIRGKQSQDLGPYDVTAGAEPNQLNLAAPIDTTSISFDNDEGPFFILGESNLVGKICRIVDIRPNDDETVGLVLVVDDPRRFTDYGAAPPIGTPTLPPTIPDNPVVTGVNVELLPFTIERVAVSWTPALGANNYIVETSTDGANFIQVANIQATTLEIDVEPGTLWVRVAGVGLGVGPYDTWTGPVGQPTGVPGDVQNLRVEPVFTGLVANVKWDQLGTATSYIVKVFTEDITQTLIEREEIEVTSNFLDYDIIQAQAAAADDRNITFEVYGKNALGNSENAATVVASNTLPPTLSGITQTLIADTGTEKTYKISWNPSNSTDLSVYRVWGDSTSGFTPTTSNQIWQGLALETNVTVAAPVSSVTNAPDTFDTGTASSTCEFTNGDTTVDPSPASSYWTVAVGALQNSGLHYVEFELDGEPTAQSNDASSILVGLINQTIDRDTTPFGTDWFGNDSDEWGVYMADGQIYHNGATGIFLLDTDGSTWTFPALNDVVGVVMEADTGKFWIGKVAGGVWTPYRVDSNPANISDPFTGAFPHFQATGTSFRFVIGDAQNSLDGQATIIPASSRATLVGGGNLYYRVAAVDVWESDGDVFNYSPEQTITP